MAEEPGDKLFEAEEFSKKATDSLYNVSESLGNVSMQMVGLAQSFKNLTDVEIAGLDANEKLLRSLSRGKDATDKVKDSTERATDKLLIFEYASRQIIDPLARIAAGANAATTALSSMSSILASMGMKSLALATTSMSALVNAYDASIKAQKDVVGVMLQSGISYKEHAAAIETGRLGLERAGATWGMLGDQAAKFQAMASGAGIGAKMGEGGDPRLNRVIRETEAAFNAAATASNALKMEMGEAMRMTTVFGTTLGLQGRDFMFTLGQLNEMGSKNALGSKKTIETTSALIEANKTFAPSLLGAATYVSAFSEELKKGTVSLETIANLASPAKMGDQALAMMVMQMQEAGVAIGGVKLNTLDLGDAIMKYLEADRARGQRFAKGEATEADKAEQAMLDPRKWGPPRVMEGMGDWEKHLALKGVGSPLAQGSALLTKEFMAKPYGEAFPGAGAGKPGEKSPAEKAAESLEAAGKMVYKDFRTSSEALAGVSNAFRNTITSSAKEFAAIIIASAVPGAIGGAGKLLKLLGSMGISAAGAAATAGIGTTAVALGGAGLVGGGIGYGIDKFLRAKTGWANVGGDWAEQLGAATSAGQYRPQKDTGGFIPETGNYKLHAGERVPRPGEGSGNISVSVGGVQVTVGERGDLKGQLHEAMSSLEGRILHQIEDQWHRATLAS